jgi:hypothetical protein
MWICLNNAFLSIVKPAANDPSAQDGDFLLVRARVKGHIEASFPAAVVTTVAGRDYQFRAYVDRKLVADIIAMSVEEIDYGNFKNSVRNRPLHDAYARVWGVMADLQEIPPYGTAPRKRATRRPAYQL